MGEGWHVSRIEGQRGGVARWSDNHRSLLDLQHVMTTSVGLALIDKELRPIVALDLQSTITLFFGAIMLGNCLTYQVGMIACM